MKKLLHFFLLLIFTVNGFAQELNKQDTLVKYFKEEYSKISKGLYKIPLDNSHLKLNTLISSIDNYLVINKDSLSAEIKGDWNGTIEYVKLY